MTHNSDDRYEKEIYYDQLKLFKLNHITDLYAKNIVCKQSIQIYNLPADNGRYKHEQAYNFT